MKILKRTISALLALVMVVTMVPMSALATEETALTETVWETTVASELVKTEPETATPVETFEEISLGETAEFMGISKTVEAHFNGHKYELYDLSMTWREAKEYCEKLGGHLVTITSAEEQAAIEKLLTNGGKNQYWLGANYSNGNYTWITGESFTYCPGDIHHNSGENYLLMFAKQINDSYYKFDQYSWNDVVENLDFYGYAPIGNSSVGFICEYSTDGNTEAVYNGHKYELYDLSMTWTEAKEYCENIGGHLVTITSSKEQAFVESILPNPSTKWKYWIGASCTSGSWTWVTGEKFDYTNWDDGQPDNDDSWGEPEKYAEIYNIGEYVTRYKWNDMVVDNNADPLISGPDHVGFICEYGEFEVEEFGYVQYFHSWDAENQIAYFGDKNAEVLFSLGYQVTEETDTSFLTNVDSLVGNYVLAKTEVEVIGATSKNKLLSIKPLVTKTGKITALDNGTIAFDNGESYTIPESLNLLSISVGDTVMYHLYEGSLIGINGTGSAGTDKDDEPDDDTEDDTDDEYMIEVYSIERNLSIKPGQELQLLCALYRNGELMPDWDGLSWGTPDGDIIEVSRYDRVDTGYRLFIKGLQEGEARFNLTDGNLKTSISLDIRVSNHNATPFGCAIDNVPSRILDEFGDKGTQVNFYNINGMYVSDFWKSEKQSNGKYTVKFNVYSYNYMHGSVDVYDANDNWIGSRRIDKKQNVRGVIDTFYQGSVAIKNAFAGKTFSYQAPTYTQKTPIEIEVPEGGRFTISNNIAASPGAFLYNTIDLYCQILGEANSLIFEMGGSSESTIKKVQDLTIEKLVADPSFNKTFQKEIINLTINASADATKRGYVDTVSGLVDTMLKYAGDIVNTAFGSVIGMTESTLLNLVPKEITIWFDILFGISEISDIIGQGIDLSRSSDKTYIVIYTPETGDKLTVQGVTAVPGQSALPANVKLNVSRAPTSEPLTIPDLKVDADEYQLYDISFISDGVEVQPNGKVTIQLPIPTNVDWQDYLVLHQKSDGTWEKLESHIEDENIVVEVNSFSLFAIVEGNSALHLLGDVNHDAKINAKDATLILQSSVGVLKPTASFCETCAEVSGDGKLNAKDSTMILQYSVGARTEFPGQK